MSRNVKNVKVVRPQTVRVKGIELPTSKMVGVKGNWDKKYAWSPDENAVIRNGK